MSTATDTRSRELTGWAALTSSRANSLNSIRLVLALLVLFSHSWPLSGRSYEPNIGDLSFGAWAVGGFFCLSGFLIANSRLRSTFPSYLAARCLRIFPGYWIALVFTAIVIAPLLTLRSDAGAWSISGAVRYVAYNMPLWSDGVYTIGGVLQHVSYGGTLNGSLWTLSFEFAAYIAVGILFFPRIPERVLGFIAASLWMILALMSPWVDAHVNNTWILHGSHLACYFLAGSALYALRDLVPLNATGAAVCAVALVVIILLGGGSHGFPSLPLAYLLLWLGSHTTPWHLRDDISYGLYVYAFPVQQVVVNVLHVHNPWLVFPLASVITALLAWVSWRVIEKPALRLKNKLPQRGRKLSTT